MLLALGASWWCNNSRRAPNFSNTRIPPILRCGVARGSLESQIIGRMAWATSGAIIPVMAGGNEETKICKAYVKEGEEDMKTYKRRTWYRKAVDWVGFPSAAGNKDLFKIKFVLSHNSTAIRWIGASSVVGSKLSCMAFVSWSVSKRLEASWKRLLRAVLQRLAAVLGRLGAALEPAWSRIGPPHKPSCYLLRRDFFSARAHF